MTQTVQRYTNEASDEEWVTLMGLLNRSQDPGATCLKRAFEHALRGYANAAWLTFGRETFSSPRMGADSQAQRRGGAMNPIPRLKANRGPVLLSYGFRPFFLFGAIYAGLAVLAWLPMFNGELELWTAFAPIDWHVHEMLYGYLPAVVTGFLLTAIPNWTGRLPIQGMPLLTLVAVWLAGRVASLFPPRSAGCWPRSLTSVF